MLKKDGVTRALLELSKIDDADDVITQIARGIANFAKCETRNRYNGNNYHTYFFSFKDSQ